MITPARIFPFLVAVLLATTSLPASELPPVHPGWKVELIARPPTLIHPSVVTTAPDGRIFVGQDPNDMAGPADAAIGRILCFHPDGRVTTYAENLHAVFGLTYLDGKLYVHHVPVFSVFTDGGDTGTDRRDLFTTNPNPSLEGTGMNDHVPANMRLGMDGWFYMSIGDKGVYGALGLDGSRGDMEGGGVLRFRPDGRQFEVYSTGTRNHLDVALNAEDEIFTYDNTDDGLGWWTRFTHMVEAGDYGYPFDYIPQRPYTLWMMEDYGSGSPAGAIAYNEDALPAEYHGNVFALDWGRRQVLRLRLDREGATFRVAERVQVGAKDFLTEGSESFRPLGIALSPDGLSFYVTDWNYPGWKSSTIAGRFFKVTYTGPSQATPKPSWWVAAAQAQPFTATDDELLAALRHPAQSVRMVAQRRLVDRGARLTGPLIALARDTTAPAHARWHAIWTLDGIDAGISARSALLELAAREPDISVRNQAIRQLGTRSAPEAAPVLVEALRDGEPTVRFRAATALGRLASPEAVPALLAALDEEDRFTRYAAFTALKRIGTAVPAAWDLIAGGLRHSNPAVREGTLFALRESFAEENLSALLSFFSSTDGAPETRAGALDLIAAMHRLPEAWDGVWWGTRPAARQPPARIHDWTYTPRVLGAIHAALEDREPAVRRAGIAGIGTAGVTGAGPDLIAMFGRESDPELRRAAVQTFGTLRIEAASPLIAGLLADPTINEALLQDAITAASRIGDETSIAALTALAARLDDPAPLAALLEGLVQTRTPDVLQLGIKYFLHDDEAVRTQAARIVGAADAGEIADFLLPLLDAEAVETQKTAIGPIGQARIRAAIPRLIELHAVDALRDTVLAALTNMPDIRAVHIYMDAITQESNRPRRTGRAALLALGDEARPIVEARHLEKPFTDDALRVLQALYDNPDGEPTGPLFAGSSRPASVSEYEAFGLKNPGDLMNGSRVFAGMAACTTCHEPGGVSNKLGPDLNGIGSRYDRKSLVESVLYPSRQIFAGYHTTLLTTRDGAIHTGFIREETPEQLVMIDFAGARTTVPVADVVRRETMPVSLMAEGLHATLSLAEFSDLIAYLESLKEGG